MIRKNIISFSIIITFFLLTAISSGCSMVNTIKDANKVGSDFMVALKEAKYDVAYALFHPDLQTNVGSIVALQKLAEDNDAFPKEWTFSSWSTSTDENGNTTAKVEGSLTYKDGRKGTVTLELVKVEDVWKLYRFDFTSEDY
jgi:hypothetical protein